MSSILSEKPGGTPPAGLLRMSDPMTTKDAKPYSCPFCLTDMLFEEEENRYRCPDCGALVELGDKAPGNEPQDTE